MKNITDWLNSKKKVLKKDSQFLKKMNNVPVTLKH